MRKIDSKDMWYMAMISVLLSFVAPNFLASFSLFLFSLICGMFYFVNRNKERNIEKQIYLLNKLKRINESLFYLGAALDNLDKIESKKVHTKKTSHRRIKRK